jgi:hypothetical protein
MKRTSLAHLTRRTVLNAAALAVAITVALPNAAHAQNMELSAIPANVAAGARSERTADTALAHASDTQHIQPPAVPGNIAVGAGYEPFLLGHATGTQNYVCVAQGSGYAFVLFTPQATLFSNSGRQLTTHFFSPNPDEAGTVRAAWQHSRDTSSVWGQVRAGNASSDPAYVAPGAIPWLLVTIVGQEEGPGGGEALTDTKFIHRVNTAGGVAPATGCSSAADVGRAAYVPYTTDYIFYRESN